jgi:hypothetical protein
MKYLLQLNVMVVSLMLCLTASGAKYPVKVGGLNPRILVDQDNVPFLLVGDSPHSLIVNLSEADAAFYLADRATNGFNSLWVELLCVPYTGGRPDGSLLDGTLPFTNMIPGTGSYDLTTPNEAYFAHVDTIIRMAATNGLQIMLDPLDTGGLTQTALDNGAARCRAYGQYLGNRYRDFSNLVWLNGNDFQSWTNPVNDGVITAIALGITDNDTNHLQTVELDYYASSSLDDPNWKPIVGLNLAYTYYPTYDEVLHAYQQSTNAPVVMSEAHYEFETIGDPNSGQELGTPLVLRHQEYWTLLSGGAGQLYGNGFTWPFLSGWQSHLDSTGVAQLKYVTALFASRAWYNLVPDINHAILTSGYGTYATNGAVSQNDYATAASTGDGALAMVYVPTVRAIAVNLGAMSGAVTASWYDPENGTYVSINGSPFSDLGTQDFTPPGNNSGGDGDWVLVLESIVDPPMLNLSLTSTNAAILAWPGYILQQNSDLTTTNWINVTNMIADVGSQYQAVIAPSGGQLFYRLQSTAGTPTMSVYMTATNTVVLSWSGYLLQQNSNLTTTNWANLTNVITVVGSEYQIVVSPLVGQQFYRLKYF